MSDFYHRQLTVVAPDACVGGVSPVEATIRKESLPRRHSPPQLKPVSLEVLIRFRKLLSLVCFKTMPSLLSSLSSI